MKRSFKLLILFASVLNFAAIQAQNTLKFRQNQFTRLVISSDIARDAGNYEMAFKKLYAAAEVCPECADSAKIEFQELFDTINAANKKLVDANKKLESEKKKAKEAVKKAEEAEAAAKTALVKMEQEKTIAEEAKNKSEGLARSGENSGAFMKVIETQPTLALNQMLYNAKRHPESKISNDIFYKTYTNPKTGLVKKVKLVKDNILCATYSLTGDSIAFGCNNKIAYLWDRNTDELIPFKGHAGNINAIEFSPDGKFLLTGSSDKTARLWNIERHEMVGEFNEHNGPISSVSFSPDGKYILTGSSDSTSKLWLINMQSVINTFHGHCGSVTSVAFSKDGKKIVTGSLDSTAIVTEIEFIINPRLKQKQKVASKGLSKNKKVVASKTSNKDIELEYEKIIETTFDNHVASINAVAFSKDGKRLAVGCADNTAKIWDLSSNSQFYNFIEHTDTVKSVTFSEDDKYLLTGSNDNSAILWDVETQKFKKIFKEHTGDVIAAGFSPTYSDILTAGTDKKLIIWQFKDKVDIANKFEEISFPSDKIEDNSFYFNNRIVKAVSSDRSKIMYLDEDDYAGFRIKDSLSGKFSKKFIGHIVGKTIFSASFSLTGDSILTASKDKTIKLWNIKNQEIISNFIDTEKSDELENVILSKDGNFIKAIYKSGKQVYWNTNTDCFECKFQKYSTLDLQVEGFKIEKEDSIIYENDVRDKLLEESQKVETFNSTFENINNLDEYSKKDLSTAYGNRSWYFILLSEYDSSETNANAGLKIDSKNNYIRVNLGHALLFQGKIEAAKKMYSEYITKYDSIERLQAGNDPEQTPEDIITADFDDLERNHRIPKDKEIDVLKMRLWLRRKQLN